MPTQQISKQRFEALAGYTRLPSAQFLFKELEWYEHDCGRVLGLLCEDGIDGDLSAAVLGRDGKGRFRYLENAGYSEDVTSLRNALFDLMNRWSKESDEAFLQGDEKGVPLDLFKPQVAANKLSNAFVRLTTGEGFSPARGIIEAMVRYYEDVDGNFVEQFQSAAFDARFWELYLFALLAEDGFIFDRTYNAPDFLCEGRYQDLFVEAVTVNPSRSGAVIIEPEVPSDPLELKRYLKDYMPIKWGGALTAKLRKEYWKLEHVEGKPIVFAVQDFHARQAMTFTHSTLPPYLYGIEFSAYYDQSGNLHVQNDPIKEHRWGDKVIESGFFNLEGAENISAVFQNPTATLSKFNRMGYIAGFGSRKIHMMKFGFAHDPDPNAAKPRVYRQHVNDPKYSELWCEGLNIYHNPRAIYPLDSRLFPYAMHHFVTDGRFHHSIPEFHPYSSQTIIATPDRRK